MKKIPSKHEWNHKYQNNSVEYMNTITDELHMNLVTLRHIVQRLLFLVSLLSGHRTGRQQVLHPSCVTELWVGSHCGL